MSCGRIQNPPGFTLCRMAKSKTRRVLRYVVWQSPKPAGFRAMSYGRIQNPPGFVLCRVANSKTRRVLRYVVWRNAKPIRYQAVGAYCIRPLGVFGRRRMIGVIKGVFFLAFRIFFSSLDGRKEAKEDQGLTEAGEVGRKRLPESSPNKFGHWAICPLAGPSKGRMQYAPIRLHVGDFRFLDNCRTQILASYRKARFGFIPSDILKRVPVGQTNRQ